MRYGWSLEEKRWKTLWGALGNLQWNSVSLLKSNATLLPADCGIYVICASAMRIPDGVGVPSLYNAVYVGRSRNLRSRFGQHCTGYGEVRQAKRAFRELDFQYTVLDEAVSKKLESLLIDALGPSANVIGGQINARIGPAEEVGNKRIEV